MHDYLSILNLFSLDICSLPFSLLGDQCAAAAAAAAAAATLVAGAVSATVAASNVVATAAEPARQRRPLHEAPGSPRRYSRGEHRSSLEQQLHLSFEFWVFLDPISPKTIKPHYLWIRLCIRISPVAGRSDLQSQGLLWEVKSWSNFRTKLLRRKFLTARAAAPVSAAAVATTQAFKLDFNDQ